MADELTRPLGLDPPPPKMRRTVAMAIVAPLVVGVVGGGYVWFGRDPGTGEPAVTAPIAGVAKGEDTGSIPLKRGKPRVGDAGPVDPSAPVLTDVGPADGAGAVVIHDAGKPDPMLLASVPREDLVEKSRYGLLPRIADDGTRPLQAYARPAEAAPAMKRVAIVIGGLGVAEEGSTAALEGLPAAVTLAFAPYGNTLPRTVGKARAAGHEILLQVPLEPYGYPGVDPGPHTLTTKASAEQNIDNLHWLMSRLTTYVGVVNYMGARFTGEPAAMAPFLREVGGRGLFYLDDGSSARTGKPAPSLSGTPMLRADVVLDADTTAAAIDARLDELATIARERGSAIATGSAFPSTVERVAAFVKAAADRGIAIVPITALLPAGKS